MYRNEKRGSLLHTIHHENSNTTASLHVQNKCTEFSIFSQNKDRSFMEDISWIAILLLMTAGQGFFLAMVMATMRRGNRIANWVLGTLLVVVSVSILLYLAITVFHRVPHQGIAFLDTLAFLYAPLIYLYFKTLLFPTRLKASLIFVLGIPALIHLGYALYIFSFSEAELLNYQSSGALGKEMAFFFTILVSYSLVCIVGAFRLFFSFQDQASRVVSYAHNRSYLLVFLVVLCLGYLISIVFTLHTLFGVHWFSFVNFYIGWTIIPFLVYGLTYLGMRNPQVMHITYIPIQKESASLSNEEMLKHKEQLVDYMHASKVYLNPKLTLQELATGMESTPTKISKLINTAYACNFYDFINRYRIEAFVEKLHQGEHKTQTFMALAYDVGFNSKTTFNKVFKKNYQTTPSAYLKSLVLS